VPEPSAAGSSLCGMSRRPAANAVGDGRRHRRISRCPVGRRFDEAKGRSAAMVAKAALTGEDPRMTRIGSQERIVRRVLTNQEFAEAGVLRESELARVTGRGMRTFDLLGNDQRVLRKLEKTVTQWVNLTPAEWQILIGYAQRPEQSMTPRRAHGGPGSVDGALTSFKTLRTKVGAGLFRSDGKNEDGDPRFSFIPPPDFRYAIIVPYDPDDVSEVTFTSKEAVYELSPATGVFVDLVVDKRHSHRDLPVHDGYIEVPPGPGDSSAPRILPISRVICGAMPELYLPLPPFLLPAKSVLVRGTWAFDLVDESQQVLRPEGTTDGFLCVQVGSRSKPLRIPIKIIRRIYRPEPRTVVAVGN